MKCIASTLFFMAIYAENIYPAQSSDFFTDTAALSFEALLEGHKYILEKILTSDDSLSKFVNLNSGGAQLIKLFQKISPEKEPQKNILIPILKKAFEKERKIHIFMCVAANALSNDHDEKTAHLIVSALENDPDIWNLISTRNKNNSNALLWATSKNHISLVRHILTAAGDKKSELVCIRCNPNEQLLGIASHMQAIAQKMSCSDAFLKLCSINETALQIAAKNGFDEIAQALVTAAGSKAWQLITEKDARGFSPLGYCLLRDDDIKMQNFLGACVGAFFNEHKISCYMIMTGISAVLMYFFIFWE